MPDSSLYYNNDLKPGGNDSVGRKAEWNGSSYQFKDDKKETSDLSLLPPVYFSLSVHPVWKQAWISRLGREIECPEYPASYSHPSSTSKSNLIDDKNQLELEPVVTWNVDFLVICGNDAIGLDKADDETLGWPMHKQDSVIFIVSESWIMDSLEDDQVKDIKPYILHAPRNYSTIDEIELNYGLPVSVLDEFEAYLAGIQETQDEKYGSPRWSLPMTPDDTPPAAKKRKRYGGQEVSRVGSVGKKIEYKHPSLGSDNVTPSKTTKEELNLDWGVVTELAYGVRDSSRKSDMKSLLESFLKEDEYLRQCSELPELPAGQSYAFATPCDTTESVVSTRRVHTHLKMDVDSTSVTKPQPRRVRYIVEVTGSGPRRRVMVENTFLAESALRCPTDQSKGIEEFIEKPSTSKQLTDLRSVDAMNYKEKQMPSRGDPRVANGRL